MKLSESEQACWEYIQKNIDDVPFLTINDVAEKSYVSLATVGRTLKKMGYSGFSEFKITVKNNTEQKQNGFSIEVNDVIHKNEIEITRTINQLSIEEVEKAITIFRQVCVISIFVIGPSISVAKEAQNKFMLFGKTVMIYNDPEAMIYYSKILPRDSLVLCISLSGKTSEIISAVKNVKTRNVEVITLTSDVKSPLAKLADISFIGYKSSLKKVSFGLDVDSRLCLSIIIRILVDCYAIEKNFGHIRGEGK